MQVDCSYFITAWPSINAPNAAQDEHRLLGEVMRVLLRHSTLPEAVLQGSLAGQEPPLPTSILHPGLAEPGGILAGAGGNPGRAQLHRHHRCDREPEETGPPVLDQRLRFRTGAVKE